MTYAIIASNGRTVATGLPSWPAAVRLADSYTRRSLDLHTVHPETDDYSNASEWERHDDKHEDYVCTAEASWCWRVSVAIARLGRPYRGDAVCHEHASPELWEAITNVS